MSRTPEIPAKPPRPERKALVPPPPPQKPPTRSLKDTQDGLTESVQFTDEPSSGMWSIFYEVAGVDDLNPQTDEPPIEAGEEIDLDPAAVMLTPQNKPAKPLTGEDSGLRYLREFAAAQAPRRAEVIPTVSPLLDAANVDISKLAGGKIIIGTGGGMYKIDKPLSDEGGTARLFIGTDRTTNEKVAIKVIYLEAHETLHERCLREAYILRRTCSPYVPQFIDLYEEKDDQGKVIFAAIIMQYVNGRQLSKIMDAAWGKRQLNQQLLPRNFALGICVQVLRALLHVASGVAQDGFDFVHRDIKPDNIMLEPKPGTDENTPLILRFAPLMLLDFGIAKLFPRGTPSNYPNRPTSPGLVMGTPDYISPGSLLNGSAKANHLTDIYAVMIMLYEMLVGETPFKEIADRVTKHDQLGRPPQIDEDIWTVLYRELNPQASARGFQNIQQAIDGLIELVRI